MHLSILPRIDDGPYPVRAKLDNGQAFSGELVLDWAALLGDTLDPEAYGLRLFKALFHENIRDAYTAARQLAKYQTEERLRIQIEIDQGAPELHALPWERLYHIQRGQLIPLAATADTPFSRYTALPIEDPEPLRERPVRLLFAISNPSGLPPGLAPLDVEAEVRSLERAVGELQEQGRLQITLLAGSSGLATETVQRLRAAGFEIEEGETSLDRILRLLATHTLFHYLGHGWFRKSDDGAGKAWLLLEDAAGNVARVADDELIPKIAALGSPPYLAFLAACESAKRDAAHPFVGLAPKLVAAGVPAVVAMQDLVPMELAQRLTAEFYRSLLRQGLPDRALNEARYFLFNQEQIDWAIPVLFMRLREGRLFEADPMREALRAIERWATDPWAPLRLEVAHFEDPGTVIGMRNPANRSPTARDLVDAHLELFTKPRSGNSKKGSARGLIVLVGERGATKTTQIRRMIRKTAMSSLEEDAKPVVPVVVDLGLISGARTVLGNPLETLVLEALEPFWPGPIFGSISDIPAEIVLRIFFGGGEELPDAQLRRAWRWVFELIRKYPRYQYSMSVEAFKFDADRLKAATDLLVIQPLSPRILRSFLNDKGEVGRSLYEALAKAQLFDLAGIPWLLFEMLEQANQGLYPRSRSVVLGTMLDNALAEIPTANGMRSRTRRTLSSLAWNMHRRRTREWPIEGTLEVVAEAKGRREYSHEGLLDRLVESNLLSRVGDEATRFSYPAIQSLCCAQWLATADPGERERWLDDIGATLGRLTRIRWWDEALVLLCGILRNPNPLLRSLLYGASLTEGEEVYLAVRCILENRSSPRPKEIANEILDQVTETLVWRLDPSNVGVTARRARALEALGGLVEERTIPTLVRVANQKVRLNWKGEYDYDYSLMRMRAVVALERLMDRRQDRIAAADSELHEVLVLWREGKLEALVERLLSGEINTPSLAVFALGHLRGEPAQQIASEELIKAFLSPATAAATRWAIADVMTRMDPDKVVQRAVLPFLVEGAVERGELEERAWKQRAHRYDCLAYLIGKTNARDPAARHFLDRCLTEFTGVSVKARAIQSLGWMNVSDCKDLFEGVATGDLKKLNLSARAKPEDRRYLRAKAIGALATLGDENTLERLRKQRRDWHPELEQALYWTTEEISWRVSRAAGR